MNKIILTTTDGLNDRAGCGWCDALMTELSIIVSLKTSSHSLRCAAYDPNKKCKPFHWSVYLQIHKHGRCEGACFTSPCRRQCMQNMWIHREPRVFDDITAIAVISVPDDIVVCSYMSCYKLDKVVTVLQLVLYEIHVVIYMIRCRLCFLTMMMHSTMMHSQWWCTHRQNNIV